MKAAVYYEYGSPDVLQVRNVEIPDPRPNELRIRMRAASVTTRGVTPGAAGAVAGGTLTVRSWSPVTW